MANGSRLPTASRKMMVSPASRISRAISFGVFCRSAPSTRAIMRSRKVSPGFDVIRTLIQSEITLVPPVTAERSPPDSRITGALSPVMAASSTEATPSTTSPSPGIRSPATISTTSPLRSAGAATCSVRNASTAAVQSPTMRFADVSVLARLRESACALPRPSAIASAKLANSTVNQSQSVTWMVNPRCAVCPAAASRTINKVVSTLPTSTTNITGFFATWRGSSLTKESLSARRTIGGSKRGRFCARSGMIIPPLLVSTNFGDIEARTQRYDVALEAYSKHPSDLPRIPSIPFPPSGGKGTPPPSPLGQDLLRKRGSGLHQQVLDDRRQRQHREEGQGGDDQDHAQEQRHEQRRVHREGAGRGRHRFLGRQVAGDRQHRHDHQETPDEHGDPEGPVVPGRVGAQAAERRAVVAGHRGEGADELRQAARR